MSRNSMPPLSHWAQLPTELLSLLVSCSTLRGVATVALVNRRLHQLLLRANQHSNRIWRDYPPVSLVVKERYKEDTTVALIVKERAVLVGDERFDGTHHFDQFASSLLSALRHVTALRFSFEVSLNIHNGQFNALVAVLGSLRHFTQLRSLEVRCESDTAGESLAAALDSLPSLTSLELHGYRRTLDHIAALHRLCSTQLDHLGLPRSQLYFLVQHRQRAAMPHLRSLAVTPSVHDWMFRGTVDGSFVDQFPSLLHLTVSCETFLQQLKSIQLPPLLSFTVHVRDISQADLTHIATRTFRLICPAVEGVPWGARYHKLYSVLKSAPRMQQLSLSDHSVRTADSHCAVHDFVTLGASSLPHLVHLDFIRGLSLADLTYLLRPTPPFTYIYLPTSPAAFTAQLTHLALRVHWDDRGAAAALLPRLPSMYPALTHVHVGVQPQPNNEQLDACAEWDAAVLSVRAAVGSAWCDSVDDVVAWRENVAWRRSVGMPMEM